ncbi:response regulator transcription factor [Reyranella soli]|uniref:DNA-binding response regulator n=1 Tax=Reyranella soli TaxID=1230389 RepID=A0A512NR30_9HYPH|nr:response regulator transcription factor [Reyranella soli]GEP61408.1 DNA-binding response regulator [Reyranella soli]
MLDVVLVDDDDLYREVLSADLTDRGFSVSCFAEGPSLLHALSNGLEAKLGLLDWALPAMLGLELLRALKDRGIGLPIVFLTGQALPERELQALDRGAIDFVDKTRGTDVLAHRLQLIIKSQRERASIGATQAQVESYGELALHRGTERALWRGQDVGLTVSEYKVLTLLASDGAPQTYRAIYDIVHFAGFIAGAGEHDTTNVRAFMKRIRQKFVAVDPAFSAIKNVRLVGYRWLAP